MTTPILRSLRRIIIPSVLALALLLMPTPRSTASAHAPQTVIVDVHVTIHNSEIGVSKETLDSLVDHLLEEAHLHAENEKADAVAVQLKIDIFMEDGGHFKIDGDLDGPPDEVENGHDHEEKIAEAQDQIDDMVTAIVHDFIHFIHHA
ncbi:MAG: hypothetical protein QOC96_2113 [Acidobacteriota bacterium]|jgi:hypothetical protein|nr:hypothetical protein [Acidobacteriota bacterium]